MTQTPPPNSPPPEPVWTYRGYQLRASEFTTAMVHFFRAEVQRANVWRQRLDTTTNWAVIATGATISLAFGDPYSHPGVILINILLVSVFLWIEARRYRYYELWSERVRLMETDFFAAMLVPPFSPAPDWAESLAESLLQPHFPISLWEALGRRLRRNYLWIYLILTLAWLAKLYLHPIPTKSFFEIVERAGLGSVSGQMVMALALLGLGLLILLALFTIGLHEASGEVLPRFGSSESAGLPETSTPHRRWTAWFRHTRQRQELLALIITSRPEEVSQAILKSSKRGVTALAGTGMFTGEPRSVLMCALTVTEVAHLKFLVQSEDPVAFVIVSPVKEILGKGFSPLNVPP